MALVFAPLAYPAEPTYPPKSEPVYVNDSAGVFDASTKAQLIHLTTALEAKTSIELAVVTVRTAKPLPLKDYAVEIFKRWGIGKKEKNNGVLLILAVEDRRVEIEVGYGLEPILTDGTCGQLLDQYVIPEFKRGNWSAGMLAGARAIAQKVGNPQTQAEEAPIRSVPAPAPVESSSTGFGFFGVLVICVIGGTLLLAVYFGKPPCPICNLRKFVKRLRSTTISHATYRYAGMKEVTYECRKCDHVWTRRESIPKLQHSSSSSSGSSWSSGGGSSFGGGSSGGGGAGRSF